MISTKQVIKSFLLYWLPLLLWMTLIFYFSSQPYQQQDLRPWLSDKVSSSLVEEHFSDVRLFYNGQEVSIRSKGAAGFVEFFIRKGAHLSVYAILAILFLRALWMTTYWKKSWMILATLSFSLLYACSDELHQMYTGNRTPLFADVLLDTFGAALGIIVYSAWMWTKVCIVYRNG